MHAPRISTVIFHGSCSNLPMVGDLKSLSEENARRKVPAVSHRYVKCRPSNIFLAVLRLASLPCHLKILSNQYHGYVASNFPPRLCVLAGTRDRDRARKLNRNCSFWSFELTAFETTGNSENFWHTESEEVFCVCEVWLFERILARWFPSRCLVNIVII